MHDLIIKGGTLVDGTGAVARTADVAVDSGRITDVGRVEGGASRIIDADGLLVTPGWVDVHTHYDGQATWDTELAPSSWHGVTTLVMGNCGVGFAPAAPDRHEWLIGLMEGVEDIPGAALAEGIAWEWETFPEYLDALERRRWTVDVGTQVPHGAVRAYVMGERGAKNEPARPEEIEAMRAIVLEALQAGALGFSTSRTIGHRAIDGEPVPGTYAAEDELFGIGAALAEARTGVFELAPIGSAGEALGDAWLEIDWMRRLSAAIERPVSYVLLQVDDDPELWRKQLAASLEACAEGAMLFPQIAGRPTGLLTGHFATYCLFSEIPAYVALRRRHLPAEEFAAALANPEVRRSIVSWTPSTPAEAEAMEKAYHRTFVLGDPPDYEPGPERSLAGLAAAAGCPRSRWPTTRWPRATGQGCSTSPSSTTPRVTSTTCTTCCCTPRAARVVRRGRAHRDHLRRLHAHVHAHPLDPRPKPGRQTAARVRREEADARHGAPLRHVRPRHRGARRFGRLQPHRLRGPDARGAVRDRGPAGGGPPAAATGDGVRRHHQERGRHLRGRRADRGAPGSAAAGTR